jgi:hypothetical protein
LSGQRANLIIVPGFFGPLVFVTPHSPMNHSLGHLLLGCLLLALFAPQLGAAVKVTEADYHKYLALEYAEALRDARKMWSRQDPARLAAADAELANAWRASGWTTERFQEVEEAIAEVQSGLRGGRDGDLEPADLRAFLEEHDRTTVATVRAHFEELEDRNPAEIAEQQVRAERESERRGAAPSEAQLQGAWVLDVDATIDWMLDGISLPEREEMKAAVLEKSGRAVFIFGPGKTIESRSRGADGAERSEKGTYRLDGHSLVIKADGSRREYELQVGMRHGKLQIGKGFGMSVFTRE